MSYLDNYRDRIDFRAPASGGSYESRMTDNIRADWEKNPSYRKVLVEFPNDTKKNIRIQTAKKSVGVDKIYVHPDDKLEPGAIIASLQNYAWLVLDTRYIGHVFQQANIVRINRVLKWVVNNTVVNQQVRVKSYSRVDGIDEFYYFTTPENTINIFLPYSELTSTIKRDQRFMIDKLPYKISKIDNFTHAGVTILFAIEDIRNPNDTDDIADYTGIVEPFPPDELLLLGEDTIRYGDDETYMLIEDGRPVIPNWSIQEEPSFVTLTVEDGVATLEVDFSLEHIGKIIVLEAEYNGEEYSKSILVVSLV